MRSQDGHLAMMSDRCVAIKQIVMIALFGLFCVLSGQAQFTNSSLNGTVLDPSGLPLVVAKITVQNIAIGFTQTATSEANGNYSFSNLPIGTYKLTATAEGFGPYVQSGIVLAVNQVATQSISLALGSVSQEVDVVATPPLVTTSSATVGELVNSEQVATLPLNGREVQ